MVDDFTTRPVAKGPHTATAAVPAPANSDDGPLDGHRYQRLFEQAPWGLFQTTLDGRYLDANQALAQLYGYPSREDLLSALTDIGSQLYADPGRREDFLQAMHAHGVLHDFEARIRRRDGSIIWISENCRVVRDSGGTPLYYEGTVVEITARKVAEQALRDAHALAQRANAAKERFLGLVTHELRTPLHAILGFAELLGQLEAHEMAERDDYVREVRDAGTTLLRTVNRLLDYTRLASSMPAGNAVLVPLESLVNNTIRQITAIPGGKPVGGRGESRVQMRHAADTQPPCVVQADPDLLRRALSELLHNALAHSDPPTPVVVEITQDARETTLAVIDQGRGMSPEDVQALAVPFGTTILQARNRQQGLSLGLPIAQTIAHMLGGRLKLSSSLLNGSTVRIILPTVRSENGK